MAQNYILLERIELNASAASVTFSNIPQSGYTDLLIKISARDSDTSGALTQVSFNGVTTNLSSRRLRGTGSAATSTAFASNIYTQGQANGDTANTFGNSEIYIPNYTSSNYKSVSEDGVSENNATAAYMQLTAGLWSSTAAITSVTLTSAAGPYLQYSTFSLYGLAAVGTTPAIAPKASGGNITTDGTYWIHTFNTTDLFIPQTALSCDYLVVAGGGGGGTGSSGGGGGAGGLRSTVTATGGGGSLESKLSVASGTSYAIIVGAGGSGTGSLKGSNSVFSTITSIGGGGSSNTTPNINGGSGAGAPAGGNSPSSYLQGTGTTNQGYGGGAGWYTSSYYPAGGGGGAGAVGGSAGDSSNAGAGGSGVAVAITGSSVYYAGGGGGGGQFSGNAGAGGNGGGGAGSVTINGTAGTTNKGGGGGGCGYDGTARTGGAGGSGIVIIRYAI